MHVLVEQIHIEMVKPAVFVLECKEWFPTHAVIDRETLSRFPRILNVGADILLAVVQIRLHVALRPRDGFADQEVGHTVTGNGPVEGHQACRVDT